MPDTTGSGARLGEAGAGGNDSATFPGIGHVYEADYGGDHRFRMTFESETRMHLQGLQGAFAQVDEVLDVIVIPLRPQLYLVSWEESNGTTVAEVHDFENGVAYVNATTPDRVFERMRGSLKKVG